MEILIKSKYKFGDISYNIHPFAKRQWNTFNINFIRFNKNSVELFSIYGLDFVDKKRFNGCILTIKHYSLV